MSNNGASSAGAILQTMADFGEGFFDRVKALGTSNSLAGVTQSSRIEPVVYLDDSITHLKEIPDILQLLQSAYAAMFLLAVETLTTEVNGVNVTQILQPLNPNRDPDYAGYLRNIKVNISRESQLFEPSSYKFTLPMGEQLTSLAREAETLAVSASIDNRTNQALADNSNLVTGKMLRVSVGPENQQRHINLSVRLRVTSINEATIALIIGDPSANHNFKQRIEDFVRGRMAAADFFLCRDVWRERKRVLAKDKSDVVRRIRERQLNHKKAGVVSGKASLNEASNLYVISQLTAMQIGAKFGLDVSKFEHRQVIFNNTCGMMLVVVDQDEERVHFYTDTIREGTSESFSDTRQAAKGNGPSIMDIFSAYKEGATARF